MGITKSKTSKQFVDDFLNSIQKVGEQLNQFSLDIENREHQIKSLLASLLNSIPVDAHSAASEKNEFDKLIESSVHLYQDKINQWMKMLENHIEGRDFINQFEKSILLVVFGNVNTGKSALGNFIAGCTSELQDIYKENPDLYVYDFSDNSSKTSKGPALIPKGEFKEGCIETTSTIQYFTLRNGLTWVDTPGIHSINSNNEGLAKKYVEFSDLVLFIVPSSSPGKADEMDEIQKLIQKQKSLLVTINKSDESIEDEVDGELILIDIPKSIADRKKQEDYMDQTLKEKGVFTYIKDANFVSISTKIAKKALKENNDLLFEQSGLPNFYKQISKVLTKNAIAMKQERPKNQINNTIREIREGYESNQQFIPGLEEMILSFKQIKEVMTQKRDSMNLIKKELISDLRAQSMGSIDTEIRKLSIRFDNGEKIDSTKISNTIENILLEEFSILYPKKVGKIIQDVHYNQAKSLNMGIQVSFEGKYETIQYNEYVQKEGYRDPKGIIEHIGALFGKKYKSSKMRAHEKSVQVQVGNNFNEIMLKLNETVDSTIEQLVNQSIDSLVEQYFVKSQNQLDEILAKLQSIDGQLSDLSL